MFTNEQLQAMIRKERISEQYPYSENDDEVLVDYLKPLLVELTRLKIRYRMESDHFGSGYASYIQLFCYTDDFMKVTEKDGERQEVRRGLHVLVSRLAPVLIIGNAWEGASFAQSGKQTGASYSMLDNPSELIIEPQFTELYNDLEQLFMKYHFTFLRKEDVEPPLPFDAHIPTLSRSKGKYLVWDAIFYWED